MIRDVLSNYAFAGLSCGVLLLFFGLFCGAALWSYRSQAKTIYGSVSRLPLQEDEAS